MTDVRRVGVELEAAEALAALSHHIISSAEDESGTFGQPLKNANKSFTTPHDGSKILRKNTNNIASMVMHSGRAEQELNTMNYKVLGSGSCIKSRNHVAEGEREQKRIRRVLANRESARQTIRRRQAMHEQLLENATVLEMENENLKTEKELALSKYSSLKSINERLKDMLDKAAKAEAIKEQSGDPDLLTIKPCTPSTTPTLPSVIPFFWPPFLHSPDVDSEQGKDKPNAIGAPVYVLPFPLFIPIQMQCTPQSSQPSIQYIPSIDVQNEGVMEDNNASNAEKMNLEVTHVTMKNSSLFAKIPSSFVEERRNNNEWPNHINSVIVSVANQDCGTAKQIEEEPQEDNKAEMEALSPSAWGLAAKSEIPMRCPIKKSGGAAAAAEARRRRKELTTLKRLYCRNRVR